MADQFELHPEYKIRLLPEDGSSNEIVRRQARMFRRYYHEAHPDKGVTQEFNLLFQDLEHGAFWRVLSRIDGSGHPTQGDGKATRLKKRQWALDNFNHHELETLLNISVNCALLVPFGTAGWPGLTRGHSLLYEELVEKSDSLFRGAVDSSFIKKLNNGRFWEELPRMLGGTNYGVSYVYIQDALMQRPEDLDINFAKKGFEIFYRNGGERSEFDIRGLSNAAIERYMYFVGKLDENHQKLGVTKKDIGFLVSPYACEIISTVDEWGTLRYRSGERDFRKRLNEPLVQEYLKDCDHARTRMAHKLHLNSFYGEDETDRVIEILSYIPNQTDMLERIVAKSDGNEPRLGEFMAKCKNAGYPLEMFLTSKAKSKGK